MSIERVLTNDFDIVYDESKQQLLIYGLENGKRPLAPITLKLSTLQEMGPEAASKWVGETILLLIPSMRKQLFKVSVGKP